MPTTPPHYREYLPGALVPWIECLWSSTRPEASSAITTHTVLPDGCMDIVFDFAEPRPPVVVGTMCKPRPVRADGRVDLLGVRFRPGGLTRFLHLDASEVTDLHADLSVFWGHPAEELFGRLADTSPAARPQLLRAALAARGPQAIDPCVRTCVEHITASAGRLPIERLETLGSFSARQIERKFSRHLGVSPKTFARIVRFMRVKAAINSRPVAPGWADLAVAFGYADQPHLVREFKALSGVTPAHYAAAA